MPGSTATGGTTRAVVSRLLKDVERAGYIKLSRGSIEILAKDKLENLCRRETAGLRQSQRAWRESAVNCSRVRQTSG